MSNPLAGAPAGVRRLFPHHREADLEAPRHRPFVIGRLLEEGDGNDLEWLCARCEEEELATWVRRCGGRQLSPRSRAFWTLVLDLEASTLAENPLWPI